MNLRQAAEQALEALEEINKLSVGEKAVCLPAEIDGAMEALRQALAQPDLAKVGEVGVWGHKREWVGLTKEEMFEVFEKYSDRPFSLMLATHDKVKEKNT